MLRLVIAVSAIVFTASSCATLQENRSGDAESENFQSKIIEAFSVNDNGARYRAYLVEWKGKEVVADDPLGQTDYKVGDTVNVLAVRVRLENSKKGDITPLSFLIMDTMQEK